jgi:hypothetical protein
MKNKTIITANSQGIIVYDKAGKTNLLKYADTYQAKSEYKNKNVQKTADNLHLNLVQRQMYRRLMYGLKEYSPEQIAAMTPSTITQVVNDYQKASKILHVMKAKVFYRNETNLVKSIFPHAKIGERDFDWLMTLPKNATLKKLGISTVDIVNEFIKRRLLPKNFLFITPENIDLNG